MFCAWAVDATQASIAPAIRTIVRFRCRICAIRSRTIGSRATTLDMITPWLLIVGAARNRLSGAIARQKAIDGFQTFSARSHRCGQALDINSTCLDALA
jgi:hypothetical protein